jgi:cobalt-zinc-cadmium efflux system membrane fusion protein
MFATVRLTDPHQGGGEAVLVVPADAVQRRGEESLVFIPLEGDGEFEARRVEVGRRQGELVEIHAGLDEGERVVTAGAFFLKAELARGELGGGHDH